MALSRPSGWADELGRWLALRKTVFALAASCALLGPPHASHAQGTQAGGDMFLIYSTSKAPDAAVEAIRRYAEGRRWQFLGASRVNQGRIALVKVCIPEVGQQLWPLGPHLGAMLPCGNLSVYEKDGRTEVALLHARYMQVLYPHPATERAGAIAQPLLVGMLEAVTGDAN